MGQLYPRTSLIPASRRQRRKGRCVPQADQGYTHKPLCLKDQQKAADPSIYLCLLHLPFCLMLVEGPWARSDILLSQFCINLLEKWSLEGRELYSCLSFASNMQESHGEVLLRPGSLPLCWPQCKLSGAVVQQCTAAYAVREASQRLASQQLAVYSVG